MAGPPLGQRGSFQSLVLSGGNYAQGAKYIIYILRSMIVCRHLLFLLVPFYIFWRSIAHVSVHLVYFISEMRADEFLYTFLFHAAVRRNSVVPKTLRCSVDTPDKLSAFSAGRQ